MSKIKESQLINVLIFDFKKLKRSKTIPYAVGFYPVSKILGKSDRVLTEEEIQKRKSDTNVTEDEDCTSQMFENLKKYKDEPNWINVKSKPLISEYELKFIAPIGSGFDSWNTLKFTLTWRGPINPNRNA